MCKYIVGDYKGKQLSKLHFCLVGLRLYVPVNNFQSCRTGVQNIYLEYRNWQQIAVHNILGMLDDVMSSTGRASVEGFKR